MKNREFKITSPEGVQIIGKNPKEISEMLSKKLSPKAKAELIERINALKKTKDDLLSSSEASEPTNENQEALTEYEQLRASLIEKRNKLAALEKEYATLKDIVGSEEAVNTELLSVDLEENALIKPTLTEPQPPSNLPVIEEQATETKLEIQKPAVLSRSLVMAAEGDLSGLNIPPEHNGAFVQFKAEAEKDGTIKADLPAFDIVIKVGETVTQQIHAEKGKGFASFSLPKDGGGRAGHQTDELGRPYQFYTNTEGQEVRIYFSEIGADRSKPYFTSNSFMTRRGGTWEISSGGNSSTHEMEKLMKQQGLMGRKIELVSKDEKGVLEQVAQEKPLENNLIEDIQFEEIGTTPIQKVENKEVIKTWYAKFPYPNEYTFENVVVAKEQNGEYIYEIKDHGDGTATIGLSEDTRTHRYAMSDMNYILQGFERLNNPTTSKDLIQLVETGIAEKRGNDWIITKPPKIRFVSPEEQNNPAPEASNRTQQPEAKPEDEVETRAPAQELKADFYSPPTREDGSFPVTAISMSQNSFAALKFENIPGETNKVKGQLLPLPEVVARALETSITYIDPLYEITPKSKQFGVAKNIVILEHAVFEKIGEIWKVSKKGLARLE